MSQGALGEVLAPAFGGQPLSQAAVGRRLSGAIAWRTDELELIADHFGVEVSDLWHPDRVALIRGLHSVRLAPGQMQMSFEERTPPLAAAS